MKTYKGCKSWERQGDVFGKCNNTIACLDIRASMGKPDVIFDIIMSNGCHCNYWEEK